MWVSGNDGPETRMDMLVDTSGGVLRGFYPAVGTGDSPEMAILPRTVSYRPEGEAIAATFDLAGIEDAYRLAYTVTGVCPPAGS